MDRRVQQALEIIAQEYSDPLSLRRIAHAVDLSPSRFEHLFKQAMRQTYQGYLREFRMTKAQALLLEGRLNVKQVAARVGFSHPCNLARAFRHQFGKTPSQCRRRETV